VHGDRAARLGPVRIERKRKNALTKTAYLALGDSISFGYKESSEKANIAANKAACEAEKSPLKKAKPKSS